MHVTTCVIINVKLHFLCILCCLQTSKNTLYGTLQHPRDAEQRVLQRLEVYRGFAEELIDYYEWGQHVNADQDPTTVFEVIESLLVNPLPSQKTLHNE